MIPSTEFRRHAAECSRMARTTLDHTSRTTWKNLAERWMTAAALAERSESAPLPKPKDRRSARAIKRFAH